MVGLMLIVSLVGVIYIVVMGLAHYDHEQNNLPEEDDDYEDWEKTQW